MSWTQHGSPSNSVGVPVTPKPLLQFEGLDLQSVVYQPYMISRRAIRARFVLCIPEVRIWVLKFGGGGNLRIKFLLLEINPSGSHYNIMSLWYFEICLWETYVVIRPLSSRSICCHIGLSRWRYQLLCHLQSVSSKLRNMVRFLAYLDTEERTHAWALYWL